MKKILFTLMLMLTVVFGANANDKKFDVEVNVPSVVHIFKADTAKIGIQVRDKYLYDLIDYSVTEDGIKVDFKNQQLLEDYQLDSNKVRIFIAVPGDRFDGVKTTNNVLVARVNEKNVSK